MVWLFNASYFQWGIIFCIMNILEILEYKKRINSQDNKKSELDGYSVWHMAKMLCGNSKKAKQFLALMQEIANWRYV